MTPKVKEQFAAHKEFLARELKHSGNIGPVKGAHERDPGAPITRGVVPNDFCADAIEIFCGDVVTQDNTNATTDPNEIVVSCRFGAAGPGSGSIWYKFVATTNEAYLQTCATAAPVTDTMIAVYRTTNPGAPCDNLVEIACNDDACALLSQVCATGLNIGETYYVKVALFADTNARGPITLSLDCACPGPCDVVCDPGATPEGEPECFDGYDDQFNGGCNSTPPVFSPITCGETVCGTSGNYSGGEPNAPLAFRDTDWYALTLTTETFVTWTVQAEFSVLAGIVDNGGVNDCTGVSAFLTFATAPECTDAVVSACLPAGTWWFFVSTTGFFDGVPCGAEYQGTLTCEPCLPGACCLPDGSCVAATGPECDSLGGLYQGDNTDCGSVTCPMPPPNNECVDAEMIDCNTSIVANNLLATPDPNGAEPLYSCSFGGPSPGFFSLWWKFVATDTSALVETCGLLEANDTMVAVYSADPGNPCGTLTEIGCNDDFCGLLSTVCVDGLTVGNTYYIRVSMFSPFNTRGDFNLSLTCPCPPPPTGACCIAGNCVDGLSADDCAAMGGTYQGDDVLCDEINCPIPPPNDNCEDAEGLSIPSSVDGSTILATLDSNAFTCVTSYSAPGVWYRVVGTGTTITAQTCGGITDYDTKLHVYCGECDALTCVTGNDDSCGLSSSVSWCSQAGATYYILVSGFSTAVGNFTLSVSEDGVGCTASVQCLPSGGCCIDLGTCIITTQDDCVAMGGSYVGDGSDCGFTGYAVEDCANPFEDISGTGTLSTIASDDASEPNVPIGFSFDFFGTSYDRIGLSANGFGSFDSVGLGDFSNDPIPNANTPNFLIAPLWDDLNGGIGTVHYQTLGAAPNRRFIAQWTGVPQLGSTTPNTFQFVLHEGTNAIEFHYSEVTAPGFAGDFSIGIENGSGTSGVSVPEAEIGAGVCKRFAATSLPSPCCPDKDGGGIGLSDLALILSGFGSCEGDPLYDRACDFNRDGCIALDDLARLLALFGQTCP